MPAESRHLRNLRQNPAATADTLLNVRQANMKSLFACIAVFLFASNSRGSDIGLPILIDISHTKPATVLVGSMEMTYPETIQWLKARFGRLDYIIFRLESNDDILPAANLARLARKSHDRVYIALLANKNELDNSYCVVPIGCDNFPYTIQKPNKIVQMPPSTATPAGDAQPSRAREEQSIRFESMQRGELR